MYSEFGIQLGGDRSGLLLPNIIQALEKLQEGGTDDQVEVTGQEEESTLGSGDIGEENTDAPPHASLQLTIKESLQGIQVFVDKRKMIFMECIMAIFEVFILYNSILEERPERAEPSSERVARERREWDSLMKQIKLVDLKTLVDRSTHILNTSAGSKKEITIEYPPEMDWNQLWNFINTIIPKELMDKVAGNIMEKLFVDETEDSPENIYLKEINRGSCGEGCVRKLLPLAAEDGGVAAVALSALLEKLLLQLLMAISIIYSGSSVSKAAVAQTAQGPAIKLPRTRNDMVNFDELMRDLWSQIEVEDKKKKKKKKKKEGREEGKPYFTKDSWSTRLSEIPTLWKSRKEKKLIKLLHEELNIPKDTITDGTLKKLMERGIYNEDQLYQTEDEVLETIFSNDPGSPEKQALNMIKKEKRKAEEEYQRLVKETTERDHQPPREQEQDEGGERGREKESGRERGDESHDDVRAYNKHDEHLKKLYSKLKLSSRKGIYDREYIQQCEQAKRLNYRNSLKYTEDMDLFENVDEEIYKCTEMKEKELKRQQEEKDKIMSAKKKEDEIKKQYQTLEQELKDKYKKEYERKPSSPQPSSQPQQPGKPSSQPQQSSSQPQQPPSQPQKASNQPVEQERGPGTMQKTSMALSDPIPESTQKKDAKGLALIKPSNLIMDKIEKAMKDDKKLNFIKNKNIEDFDQKDLKEIDLVFGGYNNVSRYYYKLLDEFFEYKKKTKNNEKESILLLIQKEKDIEGLKNIIIKLKSYLEQFKSACEKNIILIGEEKDRIIDEKSSEFRDVFDYLKHLFNKEIELQLMTAKTNIKILKAEKRVAMDKVKYLEDKGAKKNTIRKPKRNTQKKKPKETQKKATKRKVRRILTPRKKKKPTKRLNADLYKRSPKKS